MLSSSRALVVAALALLPGAAFAVDRPHPMLLHSAYTPFTADGLALNLTENVPKLAVQAAAMGVNTLFVCGTMAEFDTMTSDERKELAEAWIDAAHAHGMYAIVNVGTTVLSEAKALAEHAAAYGADAIATVPPYYNRLGSVDDLVAWLQDLASAAPDLPFWYYHLPAITFVDISIAELLAKSEAAGFTQFVDDGGVKYVGADFNDFLDASTWATATGTGVPAARNAQLLFAPEPKLQGFALQSPWAGAVLAEDFYAPTYARMRSLYEAGDGAGAIQEQNWKMVSAEGIFNTYGGVGAKRRTYLESCGVQMGPSRVTDPFDEAQWPDLYQALDAIGFWDQTAPTAVAKKA